jgi:hypothetical protein
MTRNAKKIWTKTIAPIRSGFTPTGFIFAEINDPDEINANIAEPMTDRSKNRRCNCFLLFLSILRPLILFRFISAYPKRMIEKVIIHGNFPAGSAASAGIAGISRRLKINGVISVALPRENPEPKM